MSGFPLEIQSKQYGTVCYSQITPLDGVKDKLNSTVSCTCTVYENVLYRVFVCFHLEYP